MYSRSASEAQGREVPLGEGIALVRDVYVADTMEQAREEFEEAVMNSYQWITHWRGLGNMMEDGEELTDAHKLDVRLPHGPQHAGRHPGLRGRED